MVPSFYLGCWTAVPKANITNRKQPQNNVAAQQNKTANAYAMKKMRP